jgi:nicotinate-nucleotide adenylyltransferase
MKIGLFGGSFNPPHQGHLYISKLALKKFKFNQIWLIPTKINPLKDAKIYSDYDKRFEKCQKLVKNFYHIRVKKFPEIQTYKLLTKLSVKYKNSEFFWLMGADSFLTLDKWQNYQEILKNYHLAVFNRNDDFLKIRKSKSYIFYQKLTKNQKNKLFLIANKINKISSTEIRKQNNNE